jgi:hypothetical protein
MTISTFSSLLDEWETHAEKQLGKVKREISLYETDLEKVRALAEVYAKPEDEILAGLLHQALLEIEEKMPYVPGDKVIRVEEGEEVYEDVGPMAKYLKALKNVRTSEKA